MPGIDFNDNRDKKFPRYVYAREPLMNVYKERVSDSKT